MGGDDVKKMIESVDEDGAGQVGYDEFEKMMMGLLVNSDPKAELAKAFKKFDPDGLGYITFERFKAISKELNEKYSDEELQQFLDDADYDGDGKVNLDDFSVLMKKRTDMFT